MTTRDAELLASGVVPDEMRDRAAALLLSLDRCSTLADLYEVGLADDAGEDICRRFQRWKDNPTKVYPTVEAAQAERVSVFRGVCTQYGRAGYIRREYQLRDGRLVVKSGVWWDAPDPGGSDTVFYFEEPAHA